LDSPSMKRPLAFCAVLCVGAGCTSTEPRLGTAYELSTLAGDPPPYVFNSGTPDDSSWVLSGTVVLLENDEWQGHWEIRRKLFGTVTLETIRYDGTYSPIPPTPQGYDYLFVTNLPGNPPRQFFGSVTDTLILWPSGQFSVDEVYTRTP